MFTDTHCHIHETDFSLDQDEVINRAQEAGVTRLICVGTTADDSAVAADFVASRKDTWFSVGHHPHEAEEFGEADRQKMEALIKREKCIAIGECGFDYWYLNASKESQEWCLRFQIERGIESDLPFIFHVRGSKDNPQDAFTDLWRVLDDYPSVRGVVHSFTADETVLEQVLKRGFAVGINGIMTFTKDEHQLAALDAVPLDKMVLETDAPFLTPHPFRGTVNEPKHLVEVARFIVKRRSITLESLADATSKTVHNIFNI
jgi:TatD DNase family protein